MRHNKIKSIFAPKFILRDVSIWNATGVRDSVHIVVRNGVIEKIDSQISASDYPGFIEIEGKNLTVLPAGVDAQVHMRIPGQQQKETAWSGCWAAVAGGVGAVLTMPNTKPVIDDIETLSLARKEVQGAQSETGVQIFFSAAMTVGQKGRQCVNFKDLANAGVLAFTDDGVGVADEGVMLQVIEAASHTGRPLLQHAEVPGHGGVLADGPVQRHLGGKAYPESAELDMVERDLKLLEKFPNARYHVLHVSCGKTIQLVSEARKNGLNVTCEVSPHHLYFNADNILPSQSSFKMNPPLRTPLDQELLQLALQSGECDFMATDHAPHEAEVKTENFKTSAFGTTGIETSLRVLIWLYQRGLLSKQRLVEVWSTSPARFLGLQDEFGEVSESRPFNAVLCDVNAPYESVTEDSFVGLSRNSCFIGSKLPGKVIMTMLRDKIHSIA
jgi:dihydroorotase